MSFGLEKEGLKIIRTLRKRYDGSVRNPYCEMECGYWYARAMSSYGLFQCASGVRYDADEKMLHISSKKRKGSSRFFLSTEKGFGTVCISRDKVELEGGISELPVDKVVWE